MKNFNSIMAILVCALLISCAKKNPTTANIPNTIWQSATSMPTARFNLAVIIYQGKIYAIGGENDGTSWWERAKPVVERFDPDQEESGGQPWQTVATTPVRMLDWVGTSLGNSLYLFGCGGGDSVHMAFERYDPDDNSWHSLSLPPINYQCFALTSAAGKIFLLGGYSVEPAQAEVYEYDPQADTTAGTLWRARAPMPTGRGFFTAVTVGTTIYAFGGYHSGWNTELSTVEAYDVATDTWTTKTSMLYPCSCFGAVAYQNKIFVVGGVSNGAKVAHCMVYYIGDDKWEQFDDIPVANARLGLAESGGKLFTFGGNPANSDWSSPATNNVEKCVIDNI